MYDFDSPKQMIAQETFARWTDLKQREQMLTILQKDGSVTNFETETITDSGRHIHVLLSAKLLGGTISGMVMDVTEIHQTRKDLQQLAGRLLSVQEEERRRLARELHDDLAQRLSVLVIEAGKVRSEGCSDEAAEILQDVQDKLISISEDVHRISRQLHPSIIEDLGLEQALSSEIHNFSRLENIPVKLEYDIGSVEPAHDIAVSLFRITQESLRNIQKHAHATSVSIQLVRENSSLLLTIKDDGRGFEPDIVRNMPGLGLKSMRERIRLINGKISYISLPGQGTTVQVRVDTSQ
jgi:signal transduction histidine kinase